MQRLVMLALSLAGCTSASSSGNAPYCVQHGSTYVCDGTSYPACNMQSGPCDPDAAVACMGCTSPAGFYCSCDDALSGPGPLNPEGGPFWLCVGTGRTCQ